MSSRLPITVCTLCLNEEDRLASCLALADQFEEWIVLDTGSTDRSLEIAEEFAIRLEKTEWAGFSETRVTHFQMATQPWILWIDADEFMTQEFVDELRNLVQGETPPPHAAYSVNRLMRFEDRWIRHGDWFPDRVTRLFRSDSWSMPERAVHESLDINGTTGALKTPLPHYSYRDREDRQKRVEKYIRLWAEQQKLAGKKVSAGTPFLRGAWKLFRGLILKRGFLDGRTGVWIAWSNAAEVYRKYALLRRIS